MLMNLPIVPMYVTECVVCIEPHAAAEGSARPAPILR